MPSFKQLGAGPGVRLVGFPPNNVHVVITQFLGIDIGKRKINQFLCVGTQSRRIRDVIEIASHAADQNGNAITKAVSAIAAVNSILLIQVILIRNLTD